MNEDDYADFVDEDPSEDWVSQSLGGTGFLPHGGHMPNGPLGREKNKTPPMTPISPMTSLTSLTLTNGTNCMTRKTSTKKKSPSRNGGLSRNGSGASTKSNHSFKSAQKAANGIDINANGRQVKKSRPPVGTPLTSSVQENFRGFTYSGGESVSSHADAFTARHKSGEEEDRDEDYVDVDEEVGTEDE